MQSISKGSFRISHKYVIYLPSWGFSGRHSIGASNATFASHRASIMLMWIWAFRVPYGFSGFWSCPWTGPAWGGWNISPERISTAPWPLLFSFTLNLLLHFGHFFSMEVTAWINGVTGIDFGFPFLLGGWWSRGCWGAAIGALFIQRKEVLGLGRKRSEMTLVTVGYVTQYMY